MAKHTVDEEEWNLFSGAYFRASMVIAQKLLTQLNGEEPDSKQYSKNLFVPLIYNIKHAIEITLKNICVKYNIDFSKSGKQGHNLEKLIDDVFKETKTKKKKIIAQVEKIYEKDDYFGGMIIKNWGEDWDKYQKIIRKYYYCDFLKELMGNEYNLEDINNTTFKYPDNFTLVRPNYQKIINNVETRHVMEIIKDINELIVASLIILVSHDYISEKKYS